MVDGLIKQRFQAAPLAVASYDYQDLADGTGVVYFYGAQQKDSTGTKHILTRQQLYSSDVDSQTATGMAGTALKYDVDFDLSAFNTAVTAKGTAVVEQGIVTDGTGFGTETGYIVYSIIHYDGSTETTIGSTQTETYDMNGDNVPKIVNVSISLTQKRFNRGDILRLNIKGYCTGVSGGDPTFTFGHDPQNRDGDDNIPIQPSVDKNISQLNFYMPFRII